MARSVANIALTLDAVQPAGERPGPRYGADLAHGVRGLRIGFVRRWHEVELVADPGVHARTRRSGACFWPRKAPRSGRSLCRKSRRWPRCSGSSCCRGDLGGPCEVAARTARRYAPADPAKGDAGGTSRRRRLCRSAAASQPDGRRGRRCIPGCRRAPDCERHRPPVPRVRRFEGPCADLSAPGPQPVRSHRPPGDRDDGWRVERVGLPLCTAVRRRQRTTRPRCCGLQPATSAPRSRARAGHGGPAGRCKPRSPAGRGAGFEINEKDKAHGDHARRTAAGRGYRVRGSRPGPRIPDQAHPHRRAVRGRWRHRSRRPHRGAEAEREVGPAG